MTTKLLSLFLISLVISMPLYSANALAGIQITRNEGSAGISGFIDAEQDIWTVEAKLTDVQEVQPEEVTIQVENGPEREFSSCQENELGETFCEMSSPLEGLQPKTRQFTVRYNNGIDAAQRASSFFHADLSAPTITIVGVRQREGQVVPEVVVEDPKEDGRCAGLKQVDFLDAESQEILHSVQQFPDNPCRLVFNEALPSQFTSEGNRKMKLRAVDVLGHEFVSGITTFRTDFVLPVVRTETLNLTRSLGFIGTTSLVTDITLEIEDGSTVTAVASSPSVSFLNNGQAACVEGEERWKCTWRDARVEAVSSLAITVIVTDEFGNAATAEIPVVSAVDRDAPQIVFFGTPRTYLEKSYLTTGRNTIILKVSDAGSGILREGVVADLGEIGGLVGSPDSCSVEDGLYVCVWDNINSNFNANGEATIRLTQLVDRVGNVNTGAKSASVVVDVAPPEIESFGVFALSPVVGKKDYFQSGDEVQLELLVKEASGLNITVDVSQILNDVDMVQFTEANCQSFASNRWKCELILPKPLKSVVGSSLGDFTLIVEDTAGNVGESVEGKNVDGKGRYTFALLSSDETAVPDFWEVRSVKTLVNFIDLDTVALIPTRMPVEVSLQSGDARAEMVKFHVPPGSCVPAEGSPAVKDVFLYAGVSPDGVNNPSVKLYLEFEPFTPPDITQLDEETFTEIIGEYNCTVQLFSKVGGSVTRQAEVQEFAVSVPFAFTALGALDENLDSKIKGIQEEVVFTIADTIKGIETVLTYLRYFAGIVQIVRDVDVIINLWKGTSDAWRAALPGVGTIAALSACKGATVSQGVLEQSISFLQVPLQILSCNPEPLEGSLYGNWQAGVLRWYNLISARGIIGLPAQNLHENMYTSIVGMCVPGILQNLEKYRQVRCREMLCYQNEVPAGIATVASCRELGEYLDCRFWAGPAVQLSPLGAADLIVEAVKAWVSDPTVLISAALQAPCYFACDVSSTASSFCTAGATIKKLIDIGEGIANAFSSWPDEVNDPYCSQIKLLED